MKVASLISLALLVCSECREEEKGIGGLPVGSMPFVVSIWHRSKFNCPGAAFSASWVVTSARCTSGKTASAMIVHSGSSYLLDVVNTRVHTVSRIYSHPSYSSTTHAFDVGLVKVNEQFGTANLATVGDSPGPGFPLVFYSWGATAPEKALILQNNLQQIVELREIALDECIGLFFPGTIPEHVICANDITFAGPCVAGDWGGPLGQLDSVTKKFTVIGVASFAVKCNADQPPLYTRLRHTDISTWIQSVVSSSE